MERPSEFALIAQLFAPLATHPGALNLTDDAAQIAVEQGCEIVVTTDALVEGVHFLPDDPAETVAAKALGVNLSDLAAKGAAPVGYFLAITLPARLDFAWLRAFARGLATMNETYAIPLMGGDTTSTPGPLTLTITAIGSVPAGTMTRRSGAHAGDKVFVSGTIGDAGGGLAVLTEKTNASRTGDAHLIARYRTPTPRLCLGQALRGTASASLDVSDGLIADLGHIADCSGVEIVIEADRIPRSDALRTLWGDEETAIVRAATAGDDYELAFTAKDEIAVQRAANAAGTAVTWIGHVKPGRGVRLTGAAGIIPVFRPGFTHF